MLDRSRIDGLAGYETSFDYALNLANWKTRFKKLPVFDSTDEFAVSSKLNKRATTIIEAFDIGKQRIRKKGLLKKILAKWQ